MTITQVTKDQLLRDLPHVLGTGRNNALTQRQLCERFGVRDARSIREAMRQLIEEGMPILSEAGEPAGYFIAENIEELHECAEGLRARGIDIIVRRRDLLRAAKSIQRPGQLPLI